MFYNTNKLMGFSEPKELTSQEKKHNSKVITKRRVRNKVARKSRRLNRIRLKSLHHKFYAR